MSQIETDELTFWVAYIPGDGEKKHYLSNGKGGVRVFKTEAAIRDYLKEVLTPEALDNVVIHPVHGEIIVPDDAPASIEVIDASPAPISTLATDTKPTAQEVLDGYIQRRKAAGDERQ